MKNNILHIQQTHNVEEMASYYALADVFFQPSLEETFGKVSAEALSCGTPVVCFDLTANPELVGEGCGAVVSAGDIGALTEQVNYILESGKNTYTKTCRDFALQNFSKDKNMLQYMQLFETLCREH